MLGAAEVRDVRPRIHTELPSGAVEIIAKCGEEFEAAARARHLQAHGAGRHYDLRPPSACAVPSEHKGADHTHGHTPKPHKEAKHSHSRKHEHGGDAAMGIAGPVASAASPDSLVALVRQAVSEAIHQLPQILGSGLPPAAVDGKGGASSAKPKNKRKEIPKTIDEESADSNGSHTHSLAQTVAISGSRVPLGALQFTSASYEREIDEMRQAHARARGRERDMHDRAMQDREMDREMDEEDQIRSRAAHERRSVFGSCFQTAPGPKRARFG